MFGKVTSPIDFPKARVSGVAPSLHRTAWPTAPISFLGLVVQSRGWCDQVPFFSFFSMRREADIFLVFSLLFVNPQQHLLTSQHLGQGHLFLRGCPVH